ncbi:hypothetical protein [Candidatus Enterococcus clewellii]|nr:hypothetical protein [Enterococcus sp. 9E7_DIV0242]
MFFVIVINRCMIEETNRAREMPMFFYRITKYDPNYRDEKGRYVGPETWTSVSDVGKKYNGSVLTYDEYIFYETMYIHSICAIMQLNSVSQMNVVSLEKYDFVSLDDYITRDEFDTLRNNQRLYKNQLAIVSRMILRETIWGKLVEGEKLWIHFGYDYYMYIGSEKEITAEHIPSTLFIEKCKSPYF